MQPVILLNNFLVYFSSLNGCCNIKIFFDFHDVFVDAKSAWIKALKEKTEEKFKSTYGISLSSGLALLMTALIEEKIQIFK